jgi:hypothetical protein
LPPRPCRCRGRCPLLLHRTCRCLYCCRLTIAGACTCPGTASCRCIIKRIVKINRGRR